MPQIEILAGFASEVPIQSRLRFTFAMGVPSVRVSMTSLFTPPFESNEYIAVAARRSRSPASDYVALAYRRLGLRGPARVASPALAVLGILIGAMGVTNLVLLPAKSPQLVVFSLLGIAAGIAGLIRLRSTLTAKRLLAAWEPSPDTLTIVGGGRDA